MSSKQLAGLCQPVPQSRIHSNQRLVLPWDPASLQIQRQICSHVHWQTSDQVQILGAEQASLHHADWEGDVPTGSIRTPGTCLQFINNVMAGNGSDLKDVSKQACTEEAS